MKSRIPTASAPRITSTIASGLRLTVSSTWKMSEIPAANSSWTGALTSMCSSMPGSSPTGIRVPAVVSRSRSMPLWLCRYANPPPPPQ